MLYTLLHRCLRASAQAKQSLEEVPERGESCGNSSDCSTISGRSPHNSPVIFAGSERALNHLTSDKNAAGIDRHHLPGDWIADRKTK